MVNDGVDAGSYEEFSKSLENKEDRDWYYQRSLDMGLDVGSADDFASMMVKPAEAGKPDANAPGTVATPATATNIDTSKPVAEKIVNSVTGNIKSGVKNIFGSVTQSVKDKAKAMGIPTGGTVAVPQQEQNGTVELRTSLSDANESNQENVQPNYDRTIILPKDGDVIDNDNQSVTLTLEQELEEAHKEQERLQGLLDARGAILDKNIPQNRFVPGGVDGVQMIDYSSSARIGDKEFNELQAAYNQNAERIRLLEAVQSGKDAGLWRGLGDTLSNVNTWDFGLRSLKDSMTMLTSLNTKKTAATDTMLANAAKKNKAEATYGDQLSMLYKAGEMIGMMVPFIIELGITGGFKGVSELGIRSTNKLVTAIGNGIKNKALNKIATTSVKALGVGASELAAGLATANTAGAAHTIDNIINRKMGSAVFDGNGKVVFVDSDGNLNDTGWFEAFYKGEMAQALEYGTEGMGNHLPISKWLGKVIKKYSPEKVVQFFARAGQNRFGEYMYKLLERTNVQGVPEELVEEELNSVLNAALVGDQNFKITDTDGNISFGEENSVFNAKDQAALVVGLTLSIGAMQGAPFAIGAVRDTYGVAKYYKLKHALDKSGSKCYAAFGDDWASWQGTIDNTTNADMLNVLTNIFGSKDLNEDKKRALLDYIKNTMQFRGYNQATMTNAQDNNNDNDDVATKVGEASTNQSYMEGYNIVDGKQKQDAKLTLDNLRAQLDEIVADGMMDEIDADPAGVIRRVEGDTNWDDQEKQLLYDYINAKAKYDGMIQRNADDEDTMIAEAHAAIDSRTNKADGNIHPVTLKDGNVAYIIDGIATPYADGSGVDTNRSSSSIIVKDAITGETKMISVSDIENIEGVIDATQEKEETEQQIKEGAKQNLENAVNGVLQFNDGDAYEMMDDDGNPFTVTIVGPMLNEQNEVIPYWVMVQFDGEGEPQPILKGALQQMADESAQRRVQAQQEAKEANATTNANTPTYSMGDEVMFDDGNGNEVRGEVTQEADDDGYIEVLLDSPINGQQVIRGKKEDLDAMLEGSNSDTEQIDDSNSVPGVEPGSVAMPIDNNGNPLFDQVSPERGLEWLENESELEPEEVAEQIILQRDAAVKALEKAKKNPPKQTTDIAKYKAAKAEYQSKLGAAQAAVDYWDKIKEIRDNRALVEQAARDEEQRRLTEQAKLEEQYRIEEQKRIEAEREALGINNVSQEIRDKWANAPKADGIADEIVLPNGERVQGHYVLVESGAATPSHDATNGFRKVEGFPIDKNGQSVNDRDYERDKEAQETTRQIADRYDSRALQTPVVVSNDGVVLSGNGRTMAGNLAASNNTDAAYNDYLQTYAQKYGFTPEQVQGMQHPRVVFVPDAVMPYNAETFAKFNQQEMKSQSKTEQAVKLGKVVDDATFGRVLDIMNGYDTLGDFYSDAQASNAAINELQAAGVFSQAQRAEMFDGDVLSAQGRELLENVLIGKAFESNPDAVRMLTEYKSLRQSVLSALAEITNNLKLGKDYSLEQELADAIALAYNARKHGYKAGDMVSPYARQGNLFQLDDGATAGDFNNATMLMLADVLNDNRVTRMKNVIRTYNAMAADAAAGQVDLWSGGVKSKEDIINEVNNIINNGKEERNEQKQKGSVQQDGTAGASSEGKPEVKPEETMPSGETLGTEPVAAAIAAAEAVTDANPTDAQKKAGNYKKGHVKVDGFDITIENAKGSTRSGKDADGKEWSVTMNNTYGYIRGTEGVDGDHIDIYLSDDPTSGNVFVIDQVKADGTFDEHKVMYGFATADEARDNYLANFSEGWTGLGTISEVTKDEFKKWIESSHRKTKPFADYKNVKVEGAQNEGEQPMTGSFGPIYTQFKGKAKEAIDWLKSKKEGEAAGALHHHTVGDISLVWGDAKTGLAKIVQKHPEVLDNLQDIIDSMEIVQESDNRIKLESDTHFAVVSKEYKGEPREKWLLTAYEKKETSEPANSRMDVESNLEGKSDDTATRQDSDVSDGKVTNNSASDQEKKEKSEAEEKENVSKWLTEYGKKYGHKIEAKWDEFDIDNLFGKIYVDGKDLGIYLGIYVPNNLAESIPYFLVETGLEPNQFDEATKLAEQFNSKFGHEAAEVDENASYIEFWNRYYGANSLENAMEYQAMKAANNNAAEQQGTEPDSQSSDSGKEANKPKSEKSRRKKAKPTGEKIEDVGEKLAGARKDMQAEIAKALDDASVASLVELPFGKAYKKPNLAKAVESGALREEDARFFEAIFAAGINAKKPILTKDEQRRKKYRVGYKTNVERWAEQTHTTLQMLKEFVEADEATRDEVMNKLLSMEYPKQEEEEQTLARLKELNPDYEGHTHEWGDKWTPNPVRVMMEVITRLGYKPGDKLDLPFTELKPITGFTGYRVTNTQGKTQYSTVSSVEDGIDRLVYLAKVKRGDSDVKHPMSEFSAVATKTEYAETGRYRVYYDITRDKTRDFDSREEADKFAAELKEKNKNTIPFVSPIKDVSHRHGYVVRFCNPLTGEYSVVSDGEFDTKAEAMAWLDENYEAANEKANASLKTEKKKREVTADDMLSVRLARKDGKTWGYSVFINEAYANNMGMPLELRGDFESRKEAKEYADSMKESVFKTYKEAEAQRKAFVYFSTGEDSRLGEDYRGGKDVTAEDFMNTFGFRGVQFGNWTNQEDRQMAVNQAYDSFMDLAKLLGVSPRALSLNGELGIAFGSRGSGWANAHYELAEVVINLTKTRGAGSLAHEWWHALDNYFSRSAGVPFGMVTDSESIAMREEMRTAFNDMLAKIKDSDYYKRSRDRGDYWGRMHEVTARLFAEWVDQELKAKGELNTFLSRGANTDNWVQMNYAIYKALLDPNKEPMSFEDFADTPQALSGFPYPTAKEVETFGDLMRNIFETVKEREEDDKVALFQVGNIDADNSTPAQQAATEAVLEALSRIPGLEVVMETAKAGQAAAKQNAEFMQRPGGTVYGWAEGNRIHLTPDGINPNTPIHEYTHLWAKAVQAKNPKLWGRIKELLRDTPVWNDVVNDPAYTSIKGNEDAVASEALSRISGKENAERMEREAQKQIDEAEGILDKADAITWYERMKRALREFWQWVGVNLFEMEGVKSIDEVTDRVLYDLMEGTDLGLEGENYGGNTPEGNPSGTGPREENRYRDGEDWRDGDVLPVSYRYGNDGGWVIGDVTEPRAELQDALESWRKKHPDWVGWLTEDETGVEVERVPSGMSRTDYVLGLTRSARQRKAMAERNERHKKARAEELAKKLGLDVEIHETADGLTGRSAKAKGWFDPRTGKIVVILSNNADAADVEKTLLHEGVAHYGLRKLVGDENMNEFLDNVYRLAENEIKQRINAIAESKGVDRRVATEEYMASLAEDVDFERIGQSKWWQKVMDAFKKLLDKAGLIEAVNYCTLSDNELRYILWRSHENLVHGTAHEGVLNMADDVVMRGELGVLPDANAPGTVAAESDGFLYRDGTQMDERDRAIVSGMYESTIASGSYQFREAVQDSMLSLRRLMEQIEKATGKKIEDWENAYMAENRMSSANHAEQEEYERRLFKPLLNEVHNLEKEGADRDEVTRYMMAKHGLERNEVMARRAADKQADSEYAEQLRNAQAAVDADPLNQTVLDALDALNDARDARADELYVEFRERDYGGITGLMGEDDLAAAESMARAEVDAFEGNHDTTRLWDGVRACTGSSLEKMYKSGVISRETYDDISSMYEYYIPLRGFSETTSDEVYAYLNHDVIPGNVMKTAKGRRSVADDPLATIAQMANSAIAQGNRNLMKQKFLKMALNHPSDVLSVNKMWLQYNEAKDRWEAVTADIDNGDDADTVRQKTEAFEQRMQALAKAEPDKYKQGKDAANIPYITLNGTLQEHQVRVKQGGIEYVITVNGNPRVAQAVNGLTNPDNDVNGAVGMFFEKGMAINRQLSLNFTTRNPEFVLSNFLRDALYSNSTLWVKESPKYAFKFNRNFVKVNPGMIYRLIQKHNAGTLDMNNEIERAFYQFIMNGGETGYTNIKNIDQQKRLIKKYLKGKAGQMPVSDAWRLIGSKLDEINRSVENCARFAAFLTSRQMGRSIERSIYDAKEVSVNFNKKGSGGKFLKGVDQTNLGKIGSTASSFGRLFFVFWNASIQAVTNFASLHRHHTAKALFMDASIYMLGAVQGAWGGGDDDDYLNLPEYVRRSNICIKIPGTHDFLTIPIGIEQRAIWGLGEIAGCMFTGKVKMNGIELTKSIMGALSSMMPVDVMEGNGDFNIATLAPSWIKPGVEVGFNKDWKGIPIYRENAGNVHDPEWTKANKKTNETLVRLTQWLSDTTGGDEKKPGYIDLNPSMIEHLFESYLGGVSTTINKMVKMGKTATGSQEFDWRNMLMASRVIKSADADSQERSVTAKYFEYLDEYNEMKRRYNYYEKKADNGDVEAENHLEELKKLPEYDRMDLVDDVMKEIAKLRREKNNAEDEAERAMLETMMLEKQAEVVETIEATEQDN